MPTKLARRGYTVREAPAETNFVVGIDSDADSDSDPEAKRGRTTACSGRAERRAAEAWRWAFQAGFTGAPLVPRSPRPHRQLIVVRASRLHGAGLEGERAVRWTAMQAGGLHHKRDSLPAPLSPVAPLVVGLFKPGSPARHSSAPSLLGLFDAQPPQSPRPIVVRASRLHGAGLEGERAVRWTAMQAGGLHHKRDSLPEPLSPVAPLRGECASPLSTRSWRSARVTGCAPLPDSTRH